MLMKHHLIAERWPAAVALACLAVTIPAAALARSGAGAAYARQAGARPPACAVPASAAPPRVSPTTVSTVEQAYYCIFSHYYAGPVLDDRVPLAGAFAGLTAELDRLGLDQADATMPALTGDRDTDWNAFAAVYQRVISALPDRAAVRQDAAAATIRGMVASLNDNHAQWQYPQLPPGYQPGDAYGLGITTSPVAPLSVTAPAEALPPLFITSVTPGSPAGRQALRPGDVIVSVNGAPPFAGSTVSEGVITMLFPQYPQGGPVTVRLRRPATGRTWTVTMTPALFPAPAPAVSARLLSNDIAYVKLPGFFPGAASQVLHAIAALARTATLRGVVLDLRGNTGGDPAEVAGLLDAFIHGAVWSYDCDVTGHCTANHTANHTGTATPLLHLPLAVLTDRNCASACDAFADAVKDLNLGTLIGTRTAGIVAGPADVYELDDGSLLGLPSQHELGALHEIINGIGVAPDYYLPLTAADLSNGRDPDIAKALTLLGGSDDSHE
jgi:carboxyl-terminal processing protease